MRTTFLTMPRPGLKRHALYAILLLFAVAGIWYLRGVEEGQNHGQKPKMIILDGPYTPELFAAQPELFMVAVQVEQGQTTDDLKKIKESSPYAQLLFFINSPSNDFFEIFRPENISDLRLMPKSAYTKEWNTFVPRDVAFHARLWAGSRMIGCLNLTIIRNTAEPPNIIPEDVYWLSVVRDLHFEYRALPFLNGGTLLGWRRECAVIPHTGDMDLATFEDEFPMALVEDSINMTGKPLQLARIIGWPGDSYEATFWAKTGRGKSFTIDMFTMYRDPKQRKCYTTLIISQSKSEHAKYREEYPWFEADFCTANLHGYVFHVPCNPDALLEADYGKNWTVDRPTKVYSYGHNVVPNDNFRINDSTFIRF
ncbi:unnamed protein product, partial [Mesorhabditis spiculigera]